MEDNVDSNGNSCTTEVIQMSKVSFRRKVEERPHFVLRKDIIVGSGTPLILENNDDDSNRNMTSIEIDKVLR